MHTAAVGGTRKHAPWIDSKCLIITLQQPECQSVVGKISSRAVRKRSFSVGTLFAAAKPSFEYRPRGCILFNPGRWVTLSCCCKSTRVSATPTEVSVRRKRTQEFDLVLNLHRSGLDYVEGTEKIRCKVKHASRLDRRDCHQNR